MTYTDTVAHLLSLLADEPPFLTIEDVARIGRVVDRTPRRWIAEGRLKALKTTRGGSGRVLVAKAELARFLGATA